MPCWRYKISDAILLDHAQCPRPSWTVRWDSMEVADIKNWASSEVKTIRVTQGVADNAYDIEVREFVPQIGDALERRWKTNGVDQSFPCAPYGIADMKEAGKMLARYADRTLKSSIEFYVSKHEPLLYRTYRMAYRYSQHAEVSLFIPFGMPPNLITSDRKRPHYSNPRCDYGVPPEWKADLITSAALRLWEWFHVPTNQGPLTTERFSCLQSSRLRWRSSSRH